MFNFLRKQFWKKALCVNYFSNLLHKFLRSIIYFLQSFIYLFFKWIEKSIIIFLMKTIFMTDICSLSLCSLFYRFYHKSIYSEITIIELIYQIEKRFKAYLFLHLFSKCFHIVHPSLTFSFPSYITVNR